MFICELTLNKINILPKSDNFILFLQFQGAFNSQGLIFYTGAMSNLPQKKKKKKRDHELEYRVN